MCRFSLRCCAVLVIFIAAGCSPAPYTARPLDQDAAIAEYAQRTGATDGLKRFAVANGYADSGW
ncbi:MAG TPA: hypothetical protein VEW72_08180, partial [Burkholderiales bacterium]|nr:hypothetical protein [Burkholderiales bacterium]